MNSQENNQEAEAKSGPLLLNIKQTAEKLNVSERTVWTLAHSKSLVPIRIGRRLLFSLATINQWIEKNKLKTMAICL